MTKTGVNLKLVTGVDAGAAGEGNFVDGSKPKGKCPECKKPVDAKYRPFCSKRCADVDLGRWFTDGYVLPGDSEIPDPMDAGDE